MKIKNLIITITSLIIIGCGSSGDSAVSSANTPVDQPVKDEILFQENFDNMTDWTSANKNVPVNWSKFRNGEQQWYPDNGHPNHHETMEILASNKNMARGGKGKSLVLWRESIDKGKNYWTSDGILTKVLDKEVKEIYVEFYIKFGDNFTTDSPSGAMKYFRISSNDAKKRGREHEFYKNGVPGYNGPMLISLYGVNQYGLQNPLAFRSDPYVDKNGVERYFFNYNHSDNIINLPYEINRGDISLNYANHIIGMEKNGKTAELSDLVNGDILSTKRYTVHSHEQVYGPKGTWTKMAFYVKMNSAPGVKDGIAIRWINDKRIFINTDIAWHTYRPDGEIPKWNAISFGGNHYFPRYPEADKREEAYAIDDIVIRSTIPASLK